MGIMGVKKAKPDARVIITVPTTLLKTQWEKQVKNLEINNVEVYVINTIAINDKVYNCDLWVADEIHRICGVDARVFNSVFKKISSGLMLGLSATIDKNNPYIAGYCPVIKTIGVDEAREKGYINDVNIYNLHIPLSKYDEEFLQDIDKEISQGLNVFSDYIEATKVLNKLTRFQTISIIKSVNPELTDGFIISEAIKMNDAVTRRKNFFYTHPKKVEIVKSILEKFKEELIITFSMSMDFSKKFEDERGVCYDSKLSKIEKKEAMNKLLHWKSKITQIHSIKALNEGADIKGLSLGINIAYTSTPREFVQKLGRVVRKEEGKVSRFINIVMVNNNGKSTEKQWCQTMTRGIKNIKNIKTIDEIL
jgi:superfamily II DNA or RNA helicase